MNLVRDGKAKRIGFEESYKLACQRGGHRRLVIARVKYGAVDAQGESTVETAPSLLAHIITEKHCQGMPLFRIEDRFDRDGTPVDRGTMCGGSKTPGRLLERR